MCGDAQAASTAKKSTAKASTSSTVKKSSHKRARHIAHRGSGYLVPPPPPYSPSILPELAYARMHHKSVKPVQVAEETEEDEEKSSVWEASGHESTKGTQTNKGVMVWNKKS
jgi:hypothetical protein